MNQNHYNDKSSTVCLDGTEVKRIREGQQLTQCYVSKMVGVTTDTISRWENKRYPTIRRENALKLAEALEVPLVDILNKLFLTYGLSRNLSRIFSLLGKAKSSTFSKIRNTNIEARNK